MLMRLGGLRVLIDEAMLSELDIEDVKGATCIAGSTHVMRTCKIGKDKYFLKFSDESMFDEGDPSMQILVEYLAYRIYQLYPGVATPNVDLVYDKKGGKVGLASSAVNGKPGLATINPDKLGKMLSAGVYVDVFLANWDVVGTGMGNVMVDKGKATRIDPGGALTFRAQGGRKGSKFSEVPGELKTMMDPGFGAGEVLSHADMKKASSEFMAVAWSSVAGVIKEVGSQVTKDLLSRGMSELAKAWQADVSEIGAKLASRHKAIAAHIKATAKL